MNEALSLRDRFATDAMSSLLPEIRGGNELTAKTAQEIAKTAYLMADAMLIERMRPNAREAQY